MAKAMKCDRCGKYYENNIIGTPLVIGLRLINKGDVWGKSYDLCPNCSKELSAFLKGEEE